ncbi:hypothetical protein F5X96DRAFT_637887 [Biscogniauxia mediterranea]|nr:hypothetical protein F5X96DRAFT_637887 [Biscogniauxia mediterranea]
MDGDRDASLESVKRGRMDIRLIPWDPDSADHVERMKQQRVACGWKVENVEGWRSLQRDGHVELHWIVLDPSHPETSSRLKIHTDYFPTQATVLQDTCKQIFSRPHKPDPNLSSFLPIGHISLDGVTPDAELETDPSQGVYSLMNFYISAPLQSFGLGGAALDTCERIAREDFNATAITLVTIANEEVTADSPRRIALNKPVPKVTNQDWYERRGYSVYFRKKAAWFDTDSTGKTWGTTGVFMRKNLV